MKGGRLILLGLLVLLTLTGCWPSARARTFEHEAFTFVIPAGWKTKAEVFGRSASTGEEYYGLGVREMVTIQYPARRGRGGVLCGGLFPAGGGGEPGIPVRSGL